MLNLYLAPESAALFSRLLAERFYVGEILTLVPCQTALIRVRRQITLRLIRIEVDCI